MPHPDAEKYYGRGLAALDDARPLAALDCFVEAMRIEQRLDASRPDMRYLSYYGLSLARANRAPQAALEAAELAVRHSPRQAELWLNLGRVYLARGRRFHALACFDRGLREAPHQPDLLAERAAVDRRQPRLLRFLPRSSWLNRWAGRLRAALHAGAPATIRPARTRSP